MKVTAMSALITTSLLITSASLALDWQMLHNQADNTDLIPAQQAVEQNPQSLEQFYVLGLVYLNLHQNEQAAQCFQRMRDLDNASIEAKWGQAEVLRRQRKIKASEKLLEEVITLHPEFAPAYISLAYIRYMQMEFTQSLKLAYRVVRKGKENIDLSNFVRAYLLVAGNRGMLAHYGGPIAKITNGTAVLPNLK